MIRRSTFILLLVFIVLLAGVAFWQRTKGSEEIEGTPTAVQEYLLEINGQITALKITSAEGKVVELSRNDNGEWELIQPENEETDSTTAESTISRLSALRVLTKLETETQDSIDLSAVGLDKPSYELSITLDDGSIILTKIGNITPTDSGYYVSGSGRGILIVDKYGMQSIIDMLDNPPIMPTPTMDTTTPTP
jgi:hypothetical protein